MKALIGIDLDERWQTAVDLFIRMRFAGAEATLLHSLEWHSPGGFIPPVQVEAQHYARRREEANAACSVAAERLASAQVASRTLFEDGDAVRNLILKADEMGADMIVAGSASKGRFGSLFFGSVGKGLSIGAHQSILIGKTPIGHDGPLTAVLATDHSDYANRCVDRLLQLRPEGIARLIVMTANRVDWHAPQTLLVQEVPGIGEEATAWVMNRLAEKNDDVCEKLKPLCESCEGRVEQSDPVAAIHATMTELKADLLILGAQGHGFYDRLSVGSTSLYEVIAEPYNTLVLRTPG